ncbi:MAG: diguanylate cyclase [Proteobacteria bacterium]|nr:diguanylate cyclase [Cystobacterineae bacterium]MCL2258776.1 diguanylate cyclase [Cystobacterineae bacterium]MCL2314403.1 diguanylate cyclase [Pseudomonadota bacterium]
MCSKETQVTKVDKLNQHFSISQEGCLVQIHGPNLGKRYVLDTEESTIGRDSKNNIVVDLDNVSRRHAKITLREGSPRVVDLGSTNGTYLNQEELVEERILRTGDLIKVGGAIFKFLQGNNVESLYYEEIYKLTIIDGLTQIYNKRYFLEFLEREFGRAKRYSRDLSLILFDVDHFKAVNDQYGHLAGDYILKELAGVACSFIRKEECFARYGGEEFAVVVPESGPQNARIFAEKLRVSTMGHTFTFDARAIPIALSLGVADLSSEMKDVDALIKAADDQLYKAKKTGRNRVCG